MNTSYPPKKYPIISETDLEKLKKLSDKNDDDNINHPKHYISHPSGIECITIVERMSFNVGNAMKYLWRADEKGASIEDLKKAKWYIEREISNRETK